MRFNLEAGYLTCLPHTSEETYGQSEHGPQVILTNHTLWLSSPKFGKDINTDELHPDVIALICLIVWYPYIKKSDELIFPRNVSPQIQKILQLHNIHPTYININQNLHPRPTKSGKALSWGGGLDSWAAYSLQPNFYDVLVREVIPENPIVDVPDYIPVETNSRSISFLDKPVPEPAGWVTWPQVLISCLWLSEKYDLGLIGLGGNLGSVYLRDGHRYHPAHLKPNHWFESFAMVGLPLYLPLAGLTDLGVMKIIRGANVDMGCVKYCALSTTYENCHECQKCKRKELMLGRDLHIPLNLPGPTLDYLQRGKHIEFAKWIDKYYQPAFLLLPKQWGNKLKEQLITDLSRYVQLLPPREESEVEHYGWALS
jgi:hypothetical protein